MAQTSVEYVNGIEVIKAFGRSASSYERFARAVDNYAHSFIDWMAHCQVWQDLALSVAPATLVAVLPVGCLMLAQGWIDPATFVLVAILSVGVFPPLYATISFLDALAQVGTTVDQISEVLDQRKQTRTENATTPTAPRGDVPGIELSSMHNRVELLTPALSERCSNQLSYCPVFDNSRTSCCPRAQGKKESGRCLKTLSC